MSSRPSAYLRLSRTAPAQGKPQDLVFPTTHPLSTDGRAGALSLCFFGCLETGERGRPAPPRREFHGGWVGEACASAVRTPPGAAPGAGAVDQSVA